MVVWFTGHPWCADRIFFRIAALLPIRSAPFQASAGFVGMVLPSPHWNYCESFYAPVTEGASFRIQTDSVKGKGLVAQKKIREGDVVHEETALCCSQNLDDHLSKVAVCGNCLLFLESPAQSVARVTKDEALTSALPFRESCADIRQVPCVRSESGCAMVFCSVRCREAAWSRFHRCGCRGRMSEEQKGAYDEFVTHDWNLGALNYSDTVFLGFRFVCMVVTNIRFHKQPVEVAYQPVSQLAKLPLTDFRLTYLLGPSKENGGIVAERGSESSSKSGGEEDDNSGQQWQQHWLRKLEESRCTSVHRYSAEDSHAAGVFLEKGVGLLDRVLRFTDEERHFFTPTRWSELLGAMLLNGQERSRPSYYEQLKCKVKVIPDAAARMDAFEEKVRAAGFDARQLMCGSRGQGIYTIGCLLNHSCEPNLQVLYTAVGDETLSIEALRDIEPGEELNISYVDETLPYPQRQLILYEHYFFICKCPKCTREAPDWERQVNGSEK